MTARIAIVGGGLSGVYAASLLERQGVKEYVLLEARSRFGGRIASANAGGLPVADSDAAPGDTDRFDLATWYWPALQPQLDRLIRDMSLEPFEQHEAGDTVVEWVALWRHCCSCCGYTPCSRHQAPLAASSMAAVAITASNRAAAVPARSRAGQDSASARHRSSVAALTPDLSRNGVHRRALRSANAPRPCP